MKTCIWLFLAAVSGTAGLNGCRPQPQAQTSPDTHTQRSKLESLSGLKLPAEAEILLAIDESAHDGTKFKKWIVESSQRPTLRGNVTTIEDSHPFVAALKDNLPGKDVGTSVKGKCLSSDWKNEHGPWQATLFRTTKGFYLDVENVVLG